MRCELPPTPGTPYLSYVKQINLYFFLSHRLVVCTLQPNTTMCSFNYIGNIYAIYTSCLVPFQRLEREPSKQNRLCSISQILVWHKHTI